MTRLNLHISKNPANRWLKTAFGWLRWQLTSFFKLICISKPDRDHFYKGYFVKSVFSILLFAVNNSEISVI